MMRVLRAFMLLVAGLGLPSLATSQNPGSGSDPVTETLTVPVFPGQMVQARLTLPALVNAPYPAVLVVAVREPGAGVPAAAHAVADALLELGIAVVRLDVPPRPTDVSVEAEPLDQPADDAYAVLQFLRSREDLDGDRIGVLGVGSAAQHAAGVAALDEATRALVLLGAAPVDSDTLGLPTTLPLLSLPLRVRAVPAEDDHATHVGDAATFLARHLQ